MIVVRTWDIVCILDDEIIYYIMMAYIRYRISVQSTISQVQHRISDDACLRYRRFTTAILYTLNPIRYSIPKYTISHVEVQYEIICHATKIGRVLSERVPRDFQTSTLSGSVRSTSDFAVSVPARNTCLAPVAAHHDMTACLCVSLFIGRGVLDEHAFLRDAV